MFCHESRRLRRIPRPVVLEGAVVLHIICQVATVKVRVEDDGAVGRVFGDLALRSPVYQDVAAGNGLERALGHGEDAVVRRVECLL